VLLEATTDYVANAEIIGLYLDSRQVTMSRDQLITELFWLQDTGFVQCTQQDDFVVVEATQRGIDLAQGRVTHPEIARPRPKG
jgi:predicted transcriptional regulator